MDNELFGLDTRGCGLPQEGGLYFTIGTTTRGGIDPRNFLIDPIYPVDEKLGIKARGLSTIERDGIIHIVDWIGENNYPNFPDWFEEIGHLGFHQRVETSFDFKQLDQLNSRFLLVHPNAYIPNVKARARLLKDSAWADETLYVDVCPMVPEKHFKDHEPMEMCAGLSWYHIVKGEEVEANLVSRSMPSFSYHGFESIGKLTVEPGFCASFPISMVTPVMYKGDSDLCDINLERAMNNGLWMEPVIVEMAEGDEDGEN